MPSQKKATSDFFKRYQSQKLFTYAFSGVFALALSLGFVSIFQGDFDTRGLMANVANIAQKKYDADLILQGAGNTREVVFGAPAENVDTLSFVILTDPTKTFSLTSPDVEIVSSDVGVYVIKKSFGGKNLNPGDMIATFTLSETAQSSLAITDGEFTSQGVKYVLSSKGE